jgi:arylformamidase
VQIEFKAVKEGRLKIQFRFMRGRVFFGGLIMNIIDISPLISPKIAVYPGDKRYERNVALSFALGASMELSSIQTTLHVGAHADAPSHYCAGEADISQVTLHPYLGRCQVISVDLERGKRIDPIHIAQVAIEAQRVLFRTRSFPNPNVWNSDFNSLSPELIEMLASKGVILVGIDTPSVDPDDSESPSTLEAHLSLARHKVAVLEGILLEHVLDGFYTLVALPLRLQGAEASPVRAVLLPEGMLQ